MGFLVSLAAKLIQWILVMGGTWLYEKSIKLVKEHEQKKINDANKKAYQDALYEKLDVARKEAARKMMNGEK